MKKKHKHTFAYINVEIWEEMNKGENLDFDHRNNILWSSYTNQHIIIPFTKNIVAQNACRTNRQAYTDKVAIKQKYKWNTPLRVKRKAQNACSLFISLQIFRKDISADSYKVALLLKKYECCTFCPHFLLEIYRKI